MSLSQVHKLRCRSITLNDHLILVSVKIFCNSPFRPEMKEVVASRIHTHTASRYCWGWRKRKWLLHTLTQANSESLYSWAWLLLALETCMVSGGSLLLLPNLGASLSKTDNNVRNMKTTAKLCRCPPSKWSLNLSSDVSATKKKVAWPLAYRDHCLSS